MVSSATILLAIVATIFISFTQVNADCSIQVNGRTTTIKSGSAICWNTIGYQMCQEDGTWYEDQCPNGAVCIEKNLGITCRVEKRNQSLDVKATDN